MSQTELDDITVRQILLNDCDNYIYNSLPTYLLDISRIPASPDHIRLSDIKLVSRSQISDAIHSQMESDLQRTPPSDREKWCKTRMRAYKSERRYAILSHRWGAGEPTFQMLENEDYSAGPELGAGIRKLLGFCRIAATEHKCSYAWSDTCCINKQSSAELEEAIRSMYRWYADSEICVVYLGGSSLLDHLKDDPWFKRGWTLQELLAPKKIKFYGQNWTPINAGKIMPNDKNDEFIRGKIEEITGVPSDDIHSFRPSCDRVSEKMRWMAPRRTTRAEDIAYSLIGIFDITMPISYGEGAWAFHRLMEAVAQRCFDPGFFAWCGTPSAYSLGLPQSPSCYELDANRARLLQLRGFAMSPRSGDPSYTMTKTGLRVNVLLVPIEKSFSYTQLNIFTLPEKLKVAIPLVTPAMDLTPDRLRSAKPGRTYALGVVNYYPDLHHDRSGSVRAKSNYLCLLLSKKESNTWMKEPTDHVVVLKCEGSLRGKVETVLLAHIDELYSAS